MNFKKLKILVTGGAGFLGSNLCRRLLDLGHDVIAIDSLTTGRLVNATDLNANENFKFIKHDIINPINLNVDWIFNFACPASPPRYQKDPISTIKTSFIGSLNMLELALKNSSKIMQASTSEVYGDPEQHPQKESYFGNVNPIGVRACYDEGKRSAEALFFDYHRLHNIEIKIIRIFNTFGPAMDPNDGRVISNFITQALNNNPITVYGDGTQTRSFCYVDDLIDGIIKMMNSDPKNTGPINLGNPCEFTLLKLANLVLNLTNSRSKIIFKPLPLDDPKQRNPDISLAKKLLNWEPKIGLREGLEKTILYFEKLMQEKSSSTESKHLQT